MVPMPLFFASRISSSFGRLSEASISVDDAGQPACYMNGLPCDIGNTAAGDVRLLPFPSELLIAFVGSE